MGSRISYNDINNSNTSFTNEQKPSDQSNVYIKDKFQLDFLDCNCCCDTTKKIVNCDFQGMNRFKDLYEMVVTPEYKLNCRCLCGDENSDTKQSIKFGLTGSPTAHLTSDDYDFSCPISSDSKIKE